MTDPTVAQPRSPDSEARWQALRERTTRGMLLYNGERERIHRLYGDAWAVPSSLGGFWRVNLADETCGCQDFRYACTDRDTGEPFMCCKHIIAAAIKRAKQRPVQDHPHACIDGWVYLGRIVESEHDLDGETVEYERVPCRRCSEAGRSEHGP